MTEALAIQNHFTAEPTYSKTGKGFIKSSGVEELQSLKNRNGQSTLMNPISRWLEPFSWEIGAEVASEEEVMAFGKFSAGLGG